MKMSSTLIRLAIVIAAVVVLVVVTGPGTAQAIGQTPILVNGADPSVGRVSTCTLPTALTGVARNVMNWLHQAEQVTQAQPLSLLKAHQWASRLSDSLKSLFSSKATNNSTNVNAGTAKAASSQLSQPVAITLANAVNILSALLQCAQ